MLSLFVISSIVVELSITRHKHKYVHNKNHFSLRHNNAKSTERINMEQYGITSQNILGSFF